MSSNNKASIPTCTTSPRQCFLGGDPVTVTRILSLYRFLRTQVDHLEEAV